MTDSQLYPQISSPLQPIWVVIPAAGSGRRMRSELPKQYLEIKNKTILEHTLECFLSHEQVAGVVVALSPDDKYWKSLSVVSQNKPIHTVDGGASRSESVMNGLNFLEEKTDAIPNSWVMVHDAARPCLSKTDLDSLLVIRSTDSVGGLLGAPVRDTMKRTVVKEELNTVSHTESRENMWHALTPQMFRLGSLLKALKYCEDNKHNVTDECSAMEFLGESPVMVECIHNNIKVTHPNDIALATFLLSERD